LSNENKRCFSIKKQSGKRNQSKTANKSKILGQTSTQIKIQRLYPCDKDQKKKLAKFIMKDFQSLKTNQQQDINSQINQTLVSEVPPRKLRKNWVKK
jgi:hypothetical protein